MDLTQEVFVRVLRAYSTYDPAKASLRTWIYRVATNHVIDYRRSRRAKEELALPLPQEQDTAVQDFEKAFEDRELLQRVEAYVGGYPQQMQQIFRLRIYSDLSFADIARLTETNESTVKTGFYRLLRQIRKEFADEL